MQPPDLTVARKNAHRGEDAAAIAWAQDRIEELEAALDMALSVWEDDYRDHHRVRDAHSKVWALRHKSEQPGTNSSDDNVMK